MGDSGFNEFKKPDPSPFRLFAESAFLPAFGNSNASLESGTQARSVTEPDESGASECERCKGDGVVTIFGTQHGDADDQPCPDCAPLCQRFYSLGHVWVENGIGQVVCDECGDLKS